MWNTYEVINGPMKLYKTQKWISLRKACVTFPRGDYSLSVMELKRQVLHGLGPCCPPTETINYVNVKLGPGTGNMQT